MPLLNFWAFARFRYMLYGILCGLLFPLLILTSLIATGTISSDIALETLRALHGDFPLFYLIDATPLIFGLLAYLLGVRRDRQSGRNG